VDESIDTSDDLLPEQPIDEAKADTLTIPVGFYSKADATGAQLKILIYRGGGTCERQAANSYRKTGNCKLTRAGNTTYITFTDVGATPNAERFAYTLGVGTLILRPTTGSTTRYTLTKSAVVTFPYSGNPTASPSIKANTIIQVKYTAGRLLNSNAGCMHSTPYGSWGNVTMSSRFNDAGAIRTQLVAYSSATSYYMPQVEDTLAVPAGTTKVSLWFSCDNGSYTGWDSRSGQNYNFTAH
jgi:hypothetical protein